MLIIQKNNKFKIIYKMDNEALIHIIKNNLLDELMLIIDKIDVNKFIIITNNETMFPYEDSNIYKICQQHNGCIYGEITLIAYSILMERLEMVKLLLSKGANINKLYGLRLASDSYNIKYSIMHIMDIISNMQIYKLAIKYIKKETILIYYIGRGNSPYKLYMYSGIFYDIVGKNYENIKCTIDNNGNNTHCERYVHPIFCSII